MGKAILVTPTLNARKHIVTLMGSHLAISSIVELDTLQAVSGQANVSLIVVDLALLDADNEMSWIGLRFIHPDCPLVALTTQPYTKAVVYALIAGARGFFDASTPPERLISYMNEVMSGQFIIPDAHFFHDVMSLFGPHEAPHVLNEMGSKNGSKLTEREKSILKLLANGSSNKEIATKLELSEKTVRNYVTSTMTKLEVSNRTQAAIWARLNGMGDDLKP